MTDRLFVYGTLAPGKPNEHVLAPLAGSWTPATLRGRLLDEGWGAALGFPALVLDEAGEPVSGLVFESPALSAHWAMLDAFETGYRRVMAAVRLSDGSVMQAWVYVLAPAAPPSSEPGA